MSELINCWCGKMHGPPECVSTSDPPVAVSEPVAWQRRSSDGERWTSWAECLESIYRSVKVRNIYKEESRKLYTHPAEETHKGVREAHRSGYQSAVEMFAESPVSESLKVGEEECAWNSFVAQAVATLGNTDDARPLCPRGCGKPEHDEDCEGHEPSELEKHSAWCSGSVAPTEPKPTKEKNDD